jgi:hypothetical protein
MLKQYLMWATGGEGIIVATNAKKIHIEHLFSENLNIEITFIKSTPVRVTNFQ